MIAIDMPMPESCNEFPCYYETEGTFANICQAKDCEHWTEVELSSDNIYKKRPEWCPLIDRINDGK